ncbi:unnamed protein product (macronuclear) [Paramecium tetraurelia]|uniref:Insertion element IS150 protein InsJ-like helix-turn-helix domain-containing protein n=1 Tax=Paramecium tetraurelia TaxID=5888 RepID=A0DSZ0_PARTE|nr:uncharacterized protein GSPATT00019850001 [Paramecium tetraurelia]CAK86157.1 unnamed protein product [Paramecium tetraurelia]|eukprot:XP_001453554.1 hypothetical protein (macronuclear) [Paramecium tetraurelia strain d4-2]
MKYAKISNQVRQAFIKRVSEKKCTIRQAAKQFGIKFSTAKAILSIYRHEGRIGKKQRRQRKLLNNTNSERETQNSLKEEHTETKKEFKLDQAPQNTPNDGQTIQPLLQFNYDSTYLQHFWMMTYMNQHLQYQNFQRFIGY